MVKSTSVCSHSHSPLSFNTAWPYTGACTFSELFGVRRLCTDFQIWCLQHLINNNYKICCPVPSYLNPWLSPTSSPLLLPADLNLRNRRGEGNVLSTGDFGGKLMRRLPAMFRGGHELSPLTIDIEALRGLMSEKKGSKTPITHQLSVSHKFKPPLLTTE